MQCQAARRQLCPRTRVQALRRRLLFARTNHHMQLLFHPHISISLLLLNDIIINVISRVRTCYFASGVLKELDKIFIILIIKM